LTPLYGLQIGQVSTGKKPTVVSVPTKMDMENMVLTVRSIKGYENYYLTNCTHPAHILWAY
jgi:hypothetical protein